MGTPKRLGKRLERVSECENASHGVLSDLQHSGGTLDQNPSHRNEPAQVANPHKQDPQQDSILENHDMSKRPNKLLEQDFEYAKPVFDARSEPAQFARPGNQNPKQKINLELHEMSKWPNGRLEQIFEPEKLVSSTSSGVSQVASLRNQTPQHKRILKDHDTQKSPRTMPTQILACQKPVASPQNQNLRQEDNLFTASRHAKIAKNAIRADFNVSKVSFWHQEQTFSSCTPSNSKPTARG